MKHSRAVVFLGTSLVVSVVAFGGCGGSTPGQFDLGTDAGNQVGPAPGTDGSTTPVGFDDSGISLFGDGSVSVPADAGNGGYADATPDVGGDGACTQGDAGPAIYPQKCAPATANECGGSTDAYLTSIGIGASLENGSGGNGFDDDCDGLVDEGCACTNAGSTKPCYLVPPSQIDPSTGVPVGWCATNSVGSLDCAGSEFSQWSGTCRGAQPPYTHDVCAPGDFNCDGVPENSDVQNCTCQVAPVTCPTVAITETPYPPPNDIKPVDGTTWVPGAQLANTTGWKWTVIGGDCDNVLPNPTFAMYSAKDTTAAATTALGKRTAVAYSTTATPNEYLATPGAPLISIQGATGDGAAAAVVYPAFALSGDYVVQGEFDLAGTHYVCTQQVQVRAPGIRAELCWDTVGTDGKLSAAAGSNPATSGANDIDIHFARLQGTTCSTHGWDDTCDMGTFFEPPYEDCWYGDESGCRDFSDSPPGWGYADSLASACIGWGSERSAPDGSNYFQGCTNPRLDRDNISCDPGVVSPVVTDGDATDDGSGFCGPENINLDNPNNGDQFVVGVNHFGNHGGSSNAHTHVNIYCNGARVVSAGYNPLTTGSASTGPLLVTPGSDQSGDIWEVATVKWDTANPQGCDVTTVPSVNPDPVRDGTGNKAVCVDSASTKNPKAVVPYMSHEFIEATGGIPTTAAGFCKH